MSRVVVGIDGSAPDGPALGAAAREARLRGAVLEVVSVWTYPPMSTEERMMVSADQVEEEARRIATGRVTDVFGPEGERDIEVALTVVGGAPVARLLKVAEEAELLVVGRRDKSRFRHLLLGSVAAQCVRHAPCPTMVVPRTDDPVPREGPVVAGVDGSSDSLRALRWAAGEAALRKAPLVAVFAWMDSTNEPVGSKGDVPDAVHLEAEAGTLLDGWIASTLPDAGDVTAMLSSGDPAEAILSEADEAAVVVTGSRGRGGFAGLMLGSVSRKVLHTAPCPVVVLPRTQTADVVA